MLLEVKHISKSFGDNNVLKDVSFSLEKGSISVLMGTNGSGKTTLFNIISGFLQADNGEVYIENNKLNSLKAHEINRLGITRTFQDMRLIGDLSVMENVMLAFTNQKGEKWWKNIVPNQAIKQEQLHNEQRAIEILKMCFINDIADSKASEISYGQQKLLNLACCIANNPKVLLLDEPVAGVNPLYRERLSEVITQLKEQGKTLLIIEHNTDFIEKVADKILFLNDGYIREFENYTILKENENVKNAFV